MADISESVRQRLSCAILEHLVDALVRNTLFNRLRNPVLRLEAFIEDGSSEHDQEHGECLSETECLLSITIREPIVIVSRSWSSPCLMKLHTMGCRSAVPRNVPLTPSLDETQFIWSLGAYSVKELNAVCGSRWPYGHGRG